MYIYINIIIKNTYHNLNFIILISNMRYTYISRIWSWCSYTLIMIIMHMVDMLEYSSLSLVSTTLA